MGNNYVIEKSFQLIRTNPLLTTNLQIVVGSDYSLYLESINSHKYLNNDVYKHFGITKTSYLEDKIPEFYKNLPINIAFYVKDDNDEDVVYNNYQYQFDTLYFGGVSKVKENLFYKEEFEYFAPLYVTNNEIPSSFIIMRVDNPGTYELSDNDSVISNTTKEKFREEIINKWKCVSLFDMTYKTPFGYWLDNNYINNPRFPKSSFEFDTKDLNYSRWYGINYYNGVYTNKSMYMEDKLRYETPHFRLEQFITEGFKNNELIFPNIANFKFLFDDTPASPFELKKYTINRYYGFYVDLELVKTLTPYKSTPLISDLKIEKNIFMLSTQLTGSTMPFNISSWDENKDYYIFAKNDLYNVVRILEDDIYYYKIISDEELSVSDITRDNEVDIVFNNLVGYEYSNYIKPRNVMTLYYDRLIKEDGVEDLYADLYLIKINDKYHVLDKSINEYDGLLEHYIRTDYGIECDYTKLTYWLQDKNSSYSTSVNVESLDDKPIIFPIYRVKFRDVRDFDFDRVDTGFANFDCLKRTEYNTNSEQKLYAVEHRDASDTTIFKKYEKSDINADKTINVSSEYISTDELFETNKNGLTDIWDKNQNICKWGYKNSISHSDYPYKLNNSNKVGFTYNRTTDFESKTPNVLTKTHDYFYRIGEFYYSGVICNAKTIKDLGGTEVNGKFPPNERPYYGDSGYDPIIP